MVLEEVKVKTNWYVIRTQLNREKSVSERIRKQSECGDLMGKVFNVIVPTETTFFLKNGKKVKREKIKFPSYIFVQTNAVGELKYFLRGVNGASGFLTNRAGDILPLTKTEVERMIGEWEESKIEKPEEENKFIVGEEVKILDGPFSSFNGKVEEIGDKKVKISVSIFGRVNLIELNPLQIERKVN